MTEQTSSTSLLACDGAALKELVQAALAWLDYNHETVNQLNVFPVPDGDTGTNMLLTMRSAWKEIAANNSTDVSEIADRLAYGAIMGSRGNSGTILSQLLRGFAQAIHGKTSFDAPLMVAGFRQAVKMAYKAVQTPVEGTILTVAREVAEEVETAAAETSDLKILLEHTVEQAKRSVARTPDLMPLLKKAGVVDSGGQGLTFILEGMLRYLNGEITALEPVQAQAASWLEEALQPQDERGYGYDVQYLLRGQDLDLDNIRADIGAMGDSMVVVGDSSLVKVHIHVHDPGVPISYGIKLGVISDVVVENMQEQSVVYLNTRLAKGEGVPTPEPAAIPLTPDDIGVVAVVPGEGLSRVFRDLGAGAIVSGGQTMNPSTEELIAAARTLPTSRVIILPNNKNVILSAQQAAQITNGDGPQEIVVIPTRTVPQGIAAMLSYTHDSELDNVVAAMQNASDNVQTGEITTATRSVEIDGVQVKTGQVIGLLNGKLTASGDSIPDVMRQILDQMMEKGIEVVTLYYGDTVTDNEANALVDALRERYAAQEFEVLYGGQPHYQYLVSAE